MKPNSKAIIYALICVFLWALIPVVAKFGQSDLNNHQFLFWSSLISFITLLILQVQQKKLPLILDLSGKNWLHAISLGFLGTYLYYILLYFGYAHAQGIEVLVIQYSWPIFVALLSILILKERLTIFRILSILLGFFGVFLVLTKAQLSNLHFENLSVDFLVLTSAFVFGLFSVLSKKINLDSITLITIYFFTATIISFISMFIYSEFALPTKSTFLPILINGIFVNGISYLFWIKALKASEASYVAPFVFLTPVISIVYLLIFFQEEFLIVYAFGLLAIIIAGLLNR